MKSKQQKEYEVGKTFPDEIKKLGNGKGVVGFKHMPGKMRLVISAALTRSTPLQYVLDDVVENLICCK